MFVLDTNLHTANRSEPLLVIKNLPIMPFFMHIQVEALLDRIEDQPPVMSYIVQQIIELGYSSWAYRVVASAGACVQPYVPYMVCCDIS